MQSRHFNTNITKATFSAPQIEGRRGESVRRCSGCSLILCIINAELTMLIAKVNAPPPLNN